MTGSMHRHRTPIHPPMMPAQPCATPSLSLQSVQAMPTYPHAPMRIRSFLPIDIPLPHCRNIPPLDPSTINFDRGFTNTHDIRCPHATNSSPPPTRRHFPPDVPITHNTHPFGTFRPAHWPHSTACVPTIVLHPHAPRNTKKAHPAPHIYSAAIASFQPHYPTHPNMTPFFPHAHMPTPPPLQTPRYVATIVYDRPVSSHVHNICTPYQPHPFLLTTPTAPVSDHTCHPATGYTSTVATRVSPQHPFNTQHTQLLPVCQARKWDKAIAHTQD